MQCNCHLCQDRTDEERIPKFLSLKSITLNCTIAQHFFSRMGICSLVVLNCLFRYLGYLHLILVHSLPNLPRQRKKDVGGKIPWNGLLPHSDWYYFRLQYIIQNCTLIIGEPWTSIKSLSSSYIIPSSYTCLIELGSVTQWPIRWNTPNIASKW